MAYMVVRGGVVLDLRAGSAAPADILIEDDTIREVGRPGLAAPEGADEIAAARRLIHPGLVNAHTHSHGNLAKGMGDRWTLELLLTAAPWIGGNRGADDIRLSAEIGAVEMVLKGCTACYDLFFEWPVPTRDGLRLVAEAYAEVGMRAVIAPMVADRSFFEAIPGLADGAAAVAAGTRSRRCAWRPGEANAGGDPRRLARLVASTATGSGRPWRRRSRTIAPTSSSSAAPLWPATSTSACTAMSPSRRCRR